MSEKPEPKGISESEIEVMSKSQKEIYEECMKNDECKKKVIDAYAKGQQMKARETEALANDRISKSAMDKATSVGWTVAKWIGILTFVFLMVAIVWLIYNFLTQGMSYFEGLFGSFV